MVRKPSGAPLFHRGDPSPDPDGQKRQTFLSAAGRTSAAAASSAAPTVGAKSRSGATSMRMPSPSAREKRVSETTAGSAASSTTPAAAAPSRMPREVPLDAPVQLPQLARDLLVAARSRVQLEQERHELGLLGHHLRERPASAASSASGLSTPSALSESRAMRRSQSRRTTSTSSRSLVPK